jgi:predicted nucleic acid-binding Zn ribbon protein
MVRAARPRHRNKAATAPQPIGTALRQLSFELGITGTLRRYDVLTAWEKIVGEKIAAVTQAQRFDNGVLIVGVRTAPWRNELTMRRHEIREKINTSFGEKIVKDIRFR